VVTVRNTGEISFTWTVEADTGELPVALEPTHGDADQAFTVTIDSRALLTGTYTATLSITVGRDGIPEDPVYLPLHVRIVDALYRTYLPTVQRR
jgi:hypothetical protein